MHTSSSGDRVYTAHERVSEVLSKAAFFRSQGTDESDAAALKEALMEAYSQVEEAERRAEQAQSDKEDAEQEAKEAQDEVDSLESDVEGLRGKVEALRDDLDEANDKLEALRAANPDAEEIARLERALDAQAQATADAQNERDEAARATRGLLAAEIDAHEETRAALARVTEERNAALLEIQRGPVGQAERAAQDAERKPPKKARRRRNPDAPLPGQLSLEDAIAAKAEPAEMPAAPVKMARPCGCGLRGKHRKGCKGVA